MKIKKNNNDINFDTLPNDIKDYIFKFNRKETSKINNEKKKNNLLYNECINELELIFMWTDNHFDMFDYMEVIVKWNEIMDYCDTDIDI